ncbi:MAG: DUF4012 domain-containing protein [SAR202 cluster bacterium]|nr:DUF4012 domain-containing protein [SAR202 cluster bacterium]
MAYSIRNHLLHILWGTALGIAGLSLTVAVLFLLLKALPHAIQAEDSFDDIGALSVTRLSDETTSQVDDLQVVLDRIRSHIDPSALFLKLTGRFSPSLGWIPALDSIAASFGIQGDRFVADIEAAQTLVSATSRLIQIQADAQNLLVNLSNSKSTLLLTEEATELKADFKYSVEQISRATAMRKSAWPLLRLPIGASFTSNIEQLEDQMMVASEIGVAASELVINISNIGDAAYPILSQLDHQADQNEALTFDDIEALIPLVDLVLKDATEALTTLQTLLHINKVTDKTLSNQIELTENLLAAFSEVNAATALLLAIVEPAMGSQGEGLSLFGKNGRLAITLDSAKTHGDSLNNLANRLSKSREALTASPGNIRSADGINTVKELIKTLEDGLRFIAEFTPIASTILNSDEPTKFLILGQSADEVRATGGFVSSIWLLTFQNGDLEDVRYHDAVRVDDWGRLILYPPAPIGLEEHMNAHVWLLRDVSWEPDFPTTAGTAKDMFKIGQRQDVDGVAALTQWAFLDIVRAIDHIPSPTGGHTITSRNLLTKLEEGTDEFGRAYMDVTLQGVLDRLKQPMSLPTLIKLSSAIRNTLETKELLLYFEDPQLQSSISKTGWDGRIQSGPTDYLYVVDSNVGWSKSDRNVERDITYKVDLTRPNGPRINLMLGYNNFSASGSAGCEPQWLNRGTNYTELKNACYWDFFRVYIPLGSKIRNISRLDLPEYSVAAEIGRGFQGEDTIRTYSSFGKKVVSGLFPLAAGKQTSINLVYDLPIEILQHDDNSINYQLLIQKQPGIRRRNVSVELSLPAGYRLKRSSTDPVYKDESKVAFTFLSTRDILLTAYIEKLSDESN